MQEIKNNPLVYTTQEGIGEFENILRYTLPKRVCKRLKNPQVYITQEGIEVIKNNPQVYTTQEGIEVIKNNPQVYTT